MNENLEKEAWLCRNCNTLVSNETSICPACSAERPEEVDNEPIPEGIECVIEHGNYTNAIPQPKPRYIFREAVLANAGDILLVLGLFCTFGTLIAPIIVDFNTEVPMIWAICVAVSIFASTMISWAILRTLAEISRILREKSE
jgi:hypothetical protein